MAAGGRTGPCDQGQPVYIVSSNPHSLANLLTGFALRHENQLTGFLDIPEQKELRQEWEDIQSNQVRSVVRISCITF